MLGRYSCGLGLALALAGCGGDSPPPTGGTPTPTPTPAPVSYTEYKALSGDLDFATACAITRQRPLPYQYQQTTDFGNTIVFSFRPQSNNSWIIKGDTLDLTFEERHRHPNSNEQFTLYYIQINTRFIQTFLLVNPEATTQIGKYSRIADLTIQRFDTQVKAYDCVFGVPTKPEDSLPSSDRDYTKSFLHGAVEIEEATGDLKKRLLEASTANLRYSASSRSLRFTVSLVGTDDQDPAIREEYGTYEGTAAVSSSDKKFAGNLYSPSGTAIGSFSGLMLGPQGAEVAIAFGLNLETTDGSDKAVHASAVFGN